MTADSARGSRFVWTARAAFGGLAMGLASAPNRTSVALPLLLFALMAWFSIATRSPRPARHAYLFGGVHMAWLSWSVHHVLFSTYAAVVVVGGLYYMLPVVATRRVLHATAGPQSRLAVVVFAIAAAASFWLRAMMPEIHYAHGQPCHALWTAPWLLHAVVVGGEPLVNALLLAVAAALVVCWRSWRLAVPSPRRAITTLAFVLGLFVVTTGLGALLVRGLGSEDHMRVAVIEPGFHPMDEMERIYRDGERGAWTDLMEQRFYQPSEQVLRAANPPALLLWPESSLDDTLTDADVTSGRERLEFRDRRRRLRVEPGNGKTRLVLGANVRTAEGLTPAAFLVDLSDGKVLGYQAKRVLVPGGEFLPLLRWMPTAMATWLRDLVTKALGDAPNCVPGKERPPLTTADGIPFGVLLCYDNAYPEAPAAQVAAGARCLCVLSNESWFRGGGEVTQMVGITVVRALELATPVVRSTQDGWTTVIGADGSLLASLPLLVGRQPASRILEYDVPLGCGRQPPLAWLRGATGPITALLLALVFLHGFVRWARLRVALTATPVAGGPGSSSAARGSGS